jgi:N5-(cytidine 5'-diphosphoramidyl)-L-glutamine hydrolase
LVGVTQRIDVVSEYGEFRDAIDQRLINWLINLGIVPVPIPNSLIVVDKDSSLNSQAILLNW